jgi:hypothetical protein
MCTIFLRNLLGELVVDTQGDPPTQLECIENRTEDKEEDMSKDAVAEFLVKIDQDESLRKELGAALGGAAEQGSIMAETAARHGLEFSSDEYAEVVDELIAVQEAGLSDAELESVAGGCGTAPNPGPIKAGRVRQFRQLRNVRLQKDVGFIC